MDEETWKDIKNHERGGGAMLIKHANIVYIKDFSLIGGVSKHSLMKW